MFIPIGTDRPPKHPPLATPILIGLNIAMAFADRTDVLHPGGMTLLEWGALKPFDFRIWQLVTSAFLHDPGSVWHIAMNMIFLWVFGCSVEGRLGSVIFTLFYFAGAVLAGLAHLAVSDAPCIGASGAVAACSGAFLAFFPRGHVRVLGIFFLVGVFQIRSVWFIGLYIVIDLMNQLWEWGGGSAGHTAYAAHLGGYAWGFGFAMLLLGFRLLPRDDYDMFYLFTQYRRRAALRALNRSQPTSLWESAAADTGHRLARHAKRSAQPEASAQALELRRTIATAIEQHALDAAAAAYRQLRAIEPEAVLLEDRQLDVANQLASEGAWAEAIAAYESLLKAYPGSRHREDVMLMLGLGWARKSPDHVKAREVLTSLKPKLRDPSKIELVDQLLAELRGGAA
jgi:membrane associated rhomboid family serine protease